MNNNKVFRLEDHRRRRSRPLSLYEQLLLENEKIRMVGVEAQALTEQLKSKNNSERVF